MIRQASAWGQFWADLSEQHKVHGCATFTPLTTHIPRPAHRGLFYSTWYRMTPLGPVYFSVDGSTMTEMLRDGLTKAGCLTLRMKVNLLAALLEEIEYKLERIL